jgi:hypothetical protein
MDISEQRAVLGLGRIQIVRIRLPLLPVSTYPDRVPATQVACQFSRQGLSTLGRSLKSIGTAFVDR